MKDILKLGEDIIEDKIDLNGLKLKAEDYNIYPKSIHEREGSILFLWKKDYEKFLIVLKGGSLLELFQGEDILSKRGKICPLNQKNSEVLRRFFPFTAPKSYGNSNITIGLGDRLGLASPGHLKIVEEYEVFPILAQQSIRELNLTGRNYEDVLNSASWAVFQEGYKSGFGADGDHLKTAAEVKMALENGFTMITLDCSEHIDSSLNYLNNKEINKRYLKIPKSIRDGLEDRYLDKKFNLGENIEINYDREKLEKIILIYLDTINFTSKIYADWLAPLGDSVDFELSIDETTFKTSIEAHFLIASELKRNGVKVDSLAPRFCGKFEKGIDYIGDIEEFKREFYHHFKISQHFGYKISVHSGSDKFKVFPIIGEITQGKYHLKTAGTNWLEAIRVIAIVNQDLFRDIFDFALERLDDARKYYSVSVDVDKIEPLNKIRDKDLKTLLDDDNARQVLHITYGLILQEKDKQGDYVFKDRIYNTLIEFEDKYNEMLIAHIGKHFKELNIKKRNQ